jgi:transposase InsO family protein
MTSQAGGINYLVHEATVADCSSATEIISNMSNQTSPAQPAANTGSSGSTTSSKIRIGQAYNTTFGMPSGIKLSQFDGTDWSNWSGMLEALLTLHEAEDVFTLTSPPSGTDADEWSSIQRRTKAYLRLYVKPDVYSLIASESEFPTFKQKWNKLQQVYGGATGSTTIFNLWIQLVQATLDDSQPMTSQLAKLNEARVNLSNASMGVTDAQYCLILLKALPPSYEVVATTILASGTPSALSYSEIIARILNEEGRRSGSSAALNAARAPIKLDGKKKKKDHSKLTCHYCTKTGHIQPDCRKKKRDETGNKKKEEGNTGNKAANSHALVPTTASIVEVNDDFTAALYTADVKPRWMMDSGATHHITPCRSDFKDYSPSNGTIRLGDKSTVNQIGVGTVVFKSLQGYEITLSNVLHVPAVKTRFMSTCALVQKGASVTFDKKAFKIILKGHCVAAGYLENNLYWLDAEGSSLNAHTGDTVTSLHTWHQRMGHMSHAALKAHGPTAVKGMDLGSSAGDIPTICHGCELGKSTRKPFPASSKTTNKILEVVHSDLAGPMQMPSIQGSSYIATFVDDHSRHTVVYFLKSKNQFAAALQKFLSWAETQTSNKLRALHSDRGGEYMAANVKDILSQRGIEHHLTMPGSPQQNGKAERFNRTIMDKAMAMLHTAGLPNGFWELAISTAVHVYNRTPSRTIKWQTPIETWNGQIPDVSYFRVFGCKGYMHVPTDKRRKLDPKAIEVTLVGYESGSKGYRLWDKHTRSVKLSRDVTFDESCFPSQQGAETHPQPTSPIPIPFFSAAAAPNMAAKPPKLRAPSPAPSMDSEEDVRQILDPIDRPSTPPIQGPALPTTPKKDHSLPSTPPPRQSAKRIEHRLPEPEPEMPGGFEDRLQRSQLLHEMDNAPRRSGRARVPNPKYFNADNAALPTRQLSTAKVMDVAAAPAASAASEAYGTPTASKASSLQATTPAPIARTAAATLQASVVCTAATDEVRQLALAELLAAAATAAVGRDPATYKEAMEADDAEEWGKACHYEMDALSKNDTWELVDLPPGRKAIKSKWVFKLKADGRFRARLVAKGFTQIPGIDYDETFSPVARFESLRLLLALAALENWEIHQMDVKSAFLNGVLNEEIYMEQPQGFITAEQENKVCRLKKALYGLKQASRAWNQQFHSVLNTLGFERTYSDAGIYVRHQHKGDSLLIVVLYVDDITIMGSSLEDVKQLKEKLSLRYEMTDLGEIQSYLGMRISRDRSQRRIEVDQSGYIRSILDRFGMADANPHPTPLPAGADVHLVKNTSQATQAEIKHYQSLISSLLYVQIGTRPDISFAVSRLAQYAANPSPQHLRLATYVLSYLLGTADMRICYDGAKGTGLHGYTDSSLGDQTDDRHSTSGYVFLLMNGAISWSSRKQRTVAQNTTEAEYMAMTDAANQAAWYRSFLSELGYSVDDPIPLHGDNKGAIDLALNPVTGRRSKHIDIKHHVIRGYIEKQYISLIRTPTEEMVADGFTKSLSRVLLHRFNFGMGLSA